MTVYVYKNLRTFKWSTASKPKAKLADHDSITLRDVTFKVYETQRLWCISHPMASGKPYRQVHAYAVGEVVDAAPQGPRVEISYHPAKGGSFYRVSTGEAVTHCDYVEFASDRRAYAVNPSGPGNATATAPVAAPGKNSQEPADR